MVNEIEEAFMARRIIAGMVTVLCFAFASAAMAANVTYVMKNGERHSGSLVYHKDLNLGLIVNGQEQTYPISEVAAILYDGNSPSQNELSQLPTSDNPPELERHTLVLRDGRILHGKVYHWDPDDVIFDTTSGRATYNANDVARLYLTGPAARSVFMNSAQPNTVQNERRGRAYGRGRNRGIGQGHGQPQITAHVMANQPWTDTGVLVRQGDMLSFSPNGTIEFGRNMTAGPEGNSGFPSRPGYPVRNVPVGTLIGRVGNSAPFVIGAATGPIPMPGDGRLFLGVNDDDYRDNNGAFDVSIYRR